MASKFKEQCLALLDLVEATREQIIVTKHGRPVARLVPLEAQTPHRSTAGSVTLLSSRDDDYFSTGELWEAEAD